MNDEIRNDYTRFYREMSKAYCEDSKDGVLDFVSKAKDCYLELKKAEVENIDALRGCLNTLEKQLELEVTQ